MTKITSGSSKSVLEGNLRKKTIVASRACWKLLEKEKDRSSQVRVGSNLRKKRCVASRACWKLLETEKSVAVKSVLEVT